MEELIRTRVGDYTIINILGEGGQGFVATGEHCYTKFRYALKFVKVHGALDPSIIKRIERERDLHSSLRHSNVAPLHTSFAWGPYYILVMGLEPGRTLDSLLKERRLLLREGLDYAKKIAEAVGYVNSAGIFHRDLKPQNVIVRPDNSIALLDFGIAIAEGLARLTGTGSCIGTPAYMAPELFLNRAIDRRTDVYALGVVLYLMLTGRTPFSGDLSQLPYQVVNSSPEPPNQINPQVSESICRLVLRALEKDPAGRYQSMEEFAAAISAELQPATRTITKRMMGRIPRRLATGAAILLVAAAVTAAGLKFHPSPRPPSRAALPSLPVVGPAVRPLDPARVPPTPSPTEHAAATAKPTPANTIVVTDYSRPKKGKRANAKPPTRKSARRTKVAKSRRLKQQHSNGGNRDPESSGAPSIE